MYTHTTKIVLHTGTLHNKYKYHKNIPRHVANRALANRAQWTQRPPKLYYTQARYTISTSITKTYQGTWQTGHSGHSGSRTLTHIPPASGTFSSSGNTTVMTSPAYNMAWSGEWSTPKALIHP